MVQQSATLNQQGSEPVLRAYVSTNTAEMQQMRKDVDTPAAIHYKGVTLVPGGFVAGESIWRQRAMNADIYTNFNATPYPGFGEAHTSEWVPSARQSRLSMLVSGKVPFRHAERLCGSRLPLRGNDLEQPADQQLHTSYTPGLGSDSRQESEVHRWPDVDAAD